ncbi:MAG: hypothetical protein ACR2PF_14490, partial [Rhizobiaceae bacterium]
TRWHGAAPLQKDVPMKRFSRLLLSCAMVLSAPVAADASPFTPNPLVAQDDAGAIDIHYRQFAHRHRDRAYYHENDSRPRTDSDAEPDERPDLYRGFDLEWIYTEGGPVRGPNGERKLRPAFRDGRTFTLFGK